MFLLSQQNAVNTVCEWSNGSQQRTELLEVAVEDYL